MAMRADGMGRTAGRTAPKKSKAPSRSIGNVKGSFGIEGSPSISVNKGSGRGSTTKRNPSYRAPQVRTARQVSRSSGGGGSYGGGGGGGSYDTYGGGSVAPNAFGAVAEIAQPATPTDDEWWNSDSGFQAEQGSLKTSLDSALANLTQQRTGYDTDFMTTLKNLGWGWGDNTKLDGFDKGAFDPTNQLGAYGQGLTNMNNDFASRGLMDSSFFADALTDFNTDMNNQYQGLVGGRNQFRNERAADELAANNEYKQALARARAESLARRDAQYGIV